MRKLTSAGNLA